MRKRKRLHSWLRFASPNRIATDHMQSWLQHLVRRGCAGKRPHGAGLAFMFGLSVLLLFNATAAAIEVDPQAAPEVGADTTLQLASPEARRVALWVSDSKDNHRLPYMIVDKANARVFVFDAHGRLQGADAALLGMARGDRSMAGIGDRKMSAIRPQDRTTPAGRFKASLDRDVHGQSILVIDYAASISLHAVVKGTLVERRAERLQSATSEDNRISFGCINVPAKFYRNVVSAVFKQTFGIVYILPEMSPASELFGFHDAGMEVHEHQSSRIDGNTPPVGR